MSVKIMKALWKSDLPATHRFVGLAFADYANDNGVCWPSIVSITKMTGLGTRTVRGSISYLKKQGVMTSKTSIKNGTIYTFNMAQLDPSSLCNICTCGNAISAQTNGSGLCNICIGDMQDLQQPCADVAKDTYIENPQKETIIEPSTCVSDPETEWKDSKYGFAEFWSSYPKKAGKDAALKAWCNLAPKRELVDAIIANINNRLSSGMWRLSEKQFIKHPQGYINGKMWKDEVIPVKQSGVDAYKARILAEETDPAPKFIDPGVQEDLGW